MEERNEEVPNSGVVAASESNADADGDGDIVDVPTAAAGESAEETIASSTPPALLQKEEQPNSSPQSSSTGAKHASIVEPPKWRFVNKAKKSYGYSSTAAGTAVEGKSAEELAVKYVAPNMDSKPDAAKGVDVGRVSIPTFDDGGSTPPVQVTPTSGRTSSGSSVPVTQSQGGEQQGSTTTTATVDLEQLQKETERLKEQQRLQEMQIESLHIKQEHERLKSEIQVAENKKQELERETEVIRETKEKMLQEKSEGAAAAAAIENEAAEEEAANSKRQRPWGLYALIVILICAIGALLGVMLSSNNENDGGDSNNLRGGDDVDTEEITPTLTPTTSKSRLPTSLSPADASATEEEVTYAIGTVEALSCPTGTKRFDLTITDVGPDPSVITWVIVDRCSFENVYRCSRCYTDFPPNLPLAFSACLPGYNEETGEGRRREYVAQMIDIAGGSNYGYILRYDGEIIVDEQDMEFSNLQLNYFGDGNGCSEMPSETPMPTQSPTTETPTPRPTTGTPTPRPTIDIAIEDKPGCTPFLDSTGTCGREAGVEHKLLLPLGMGELENQIFGSSVTFVGDTRRIIAVGSGVQGSPVHIYHKVEEDLVLEDDGLPPDQVEDSYVWEYLTSIELVEWETSNVFFGASLDSNPEGYLVVGAPMWVSNGDSGKVYVYRPNTDLTEWSMVARLSGTDGAAATSFGSTVAFDGALIAVGSPEERNQKGSVYIFEHAGPLGQGNQWVESVKLSPEDVADGARFGWSVSLFGDTPATLAVGAPKDTGGGSAFVYKRSDFDWVSQKLKPRDVQEGDDFGSNVVIHGCSVAVSSLGDGTASKTGTGSVRIYNLNAGVSDYWIHSQIVEPTDQLSGEVFGQCIAMEGNTLLVGSPTGGEGGEQSGVIYHFERIGGLWAKISVIPNKDYVSGDQDDFGCPLSLSGDLFVAGSRGDSTLGVLSGSALIYDLCPNVEDV